MNAENDISKVPTHLGIIMDGSRRWAQSNGLPKLQGHDYGYKRFKEVADIVFERGVKILTAYVFSKENWQRADVEVKYLLNLLEWVVTNEVDELHRKNIRIRCLGSEEKLKPSIVRAIKAAEAKTINNTGGTVALCLNYSGQDEIADAAAALLKSGINASDVNAQKLTEHMYAPDIPNLDLIIRTSGEQRLSNFMLWRAGYAELLFVEKHWPDFTVEDLDDALAEYASRQRRFGK